MGLYLKNGYINIDEIARNNCTFNFLIGARQIGKTYGILKYELDNNKFIYLRRTAAELEFCAAENPAEKIYETEKDEKYNIIFDRGSKYTFNILREDKIIGLGLSLNSIAKIRGFNMSSFSEIVYDEFIPEKHVNKMKYEAEAFFNAYETINSNRELNGEKPVKVWFLANTNNLDSAILNGFGIVSIIEKMQRKNKNISILKDRGIAIYNFCNSPISEKKKETALYTAIKNSEFSQMAIENKFAYNDFSNIYSKNIVEFIPIFTLGNLTVLKHKSDGTIYVINKFIKCSKHFPDNETGIQNARMNFGALYYYYINGDIYFNSFATKNEFLKLFDW